MKLPERDPRTPGERITGAVFLAGFAGLMAMALFDHYTPARLAMVFVPAWMVVLLAVHEAGHAIAARLVGWELREVVIGCGTEWKRWLLGGVPVSFRIWPVSGWVQTKIGSLDHARWRSAFIFAAGPLAEALVILAVWAVTGRALFQPPAGIGQVLLQSLALAAAIDLITNLAPFSFEHESGDACSDGLGILRSLRASDADFRRSKQQEEWREAVEPGSKDASTEPGPPAGPPPVVGNQ